MKGIYHISLVYATGILIACAISCSSQPDTKVWTLDQQLHTTDGIYRMSYATLPGVELTRIDDAAHFLFIDQPQAFFAELDAFLAQ